MFHNYNVVRLRAMDQQLIQWTKIIQVMVIALCTRSAGLHAYVINLAYAKCR